MAGGIIQLVAYGAQDIYLTGNPQITFFKAVYKRHTMFAMERFQQYPIGTINWGNNLTFNIDRKADLLGPCYLQFVLEFYDSNSTKLLFNEIRQHLISNQVTNALAKSFGYSLIDTIDIEIGGTKIDTQTGHWMAIKAELTKNFNEQFNNILITNGFYRASQVSEYAVLISIPLQFWFNNNPGLYLPLIALQYHDVKIDVKLNDINKILLSNTNNGGGNNDPTKSITKIDIIEFNLYCDYVYLDTEERKKFAQKSHEYLIDQLQVLPSEFCSSSTNIMSIPLILNHPVKELVWTIHDIDNDAINSTKKLGHLWSGQKDRIKTVKLHLNGTARFSDDSPGIYFQTVQRNQHYSGIDFHKFITEMQGFLTGNAQQISSIAGDTPIGPVAALDPFVYSFSLEPEKYQPSGSCNFSRLDNATLTLIVNTSIPDDISRNLEAKIYATNYNVLRIMNGMGGLAYSN